MIIFNNTDISLQLCPVKIYFCDTIIEHATRNKIHHSFMYFLTALLTQFFHSNEFIGLWWHFLYSTNKIYLTSYKWKSETVFGVSFFKFFLTSVVSTARLQTFSKICSCLRFAKWARVSCSLFSVWINRNISMNNQATFHITK